MTSMQNKAISNINFEVKCSFTTCQTNLQHGQLSCVVCICDVVQVDFPGGMWGKDVQAKYKGRQMPCKELGL